MDPDSITLTAIFSKATTTVDGGWRITFDVDQSEAQSILKLSVLRDQLFQMALIPIVHGVNPD